MVDAAGPIKFAAGGSTEKMRVDSSGNVGIGTTTPDQLLSIYSATTPSLEFSSASGPTNKWTMGIDTADANKFKIASSTAVGTNARLTIDGSGNVSISAGASSNYGLTVDVGSSNNVALFTGTGSTPGATVAIGFNSSNIYGKLYGATDNSFNLNATYGSWPANAMNFLIGGVNVMNLTPAGALGGNYKLAIATTTATSTLSTGGLTVGTSQFVVQQNSGNVGIGTTSPWGFLSVNPNNIGSGPEFVIGSSTATHFIVTNAGSIGLGTTPPMDRLSVVGNIAVTGCAKAATSTTGLLNACLDLAESYTAGEPLAPGDVVAVQSDPSAPDGFSLIRATSSASAIGIVSTRPAVFLQGETAFFGGSHFNASSTFPQGSEVPLALAGRVPVTVSLANGPIFVGDPLTLDSSASSGVATKAIEAGHIMGYALQSFPPLLTSGTTFSNQATGTVLIFISPHFWMPNTSLTLFQQGTSTPSTMEHGVNLQVFLTLVIDTLKTLGVTIQQGVVQVTNFIAEKITTNTLEIGSTTKPTNITVYDKNGKVGCLVIQDVSAGKMQLTAGVCGSQTGNQEPQPSLQTSQTSAGKAGTIGQGTTTNTTATSTGAIGSTIDSVSAAVPITSTATDTATTTTQNRR